MQKIKVLARFYDPLTPCAKIFTVIKKFAPPPLKKEGSRAKKGDFFAVLRSSLIFQPIFTCNIAMESS